MIDYSHKRYTRKVLGIITYFVSFILLLFEQTMAAFKHKENTQVNEIHTNIESESDSDFFDDSSNEESDDEDDLSA